MKFLIKVIIAWFKRNETPVVIYGADGVPITSYNTKAKECWFPKIQEKHPALVMVGIVIH